MQALPAEPEPATPPDAWVPPVPEFVDIPADLPVLEPSVTITLPLNEQITSAVVVPNKHHGSDVLYVAVTQERVNVWAAVVYFVPEIALGLTGLLILIALRKLWVGRRFLHRKGEAYCKKCWAGLTGVESDTCPECGKPIAKTRRVAKRSRRSPLSPRWVWAGVAVLATLGSATIWFGEGWCTAWRYGMDPRDHYTRRQLYNYADRDSVFRINKMAGWFEWHSAKLSEFGRENDLSWVETLDDTYRSGEGTYTHYTVRRYATDSGELLDSLPIPTSTDLQNKNYINWPWLMLVDNTIFIHDGDNFYRLHQQNADPWKVIGSGYASDHLAVLAVTSDARYVILGLYNEDWYQGSQVGFYRLVAFNSESGTEVASLVLSPALERAIGLNDLAGLPASETLRLKPDMRLRDVALIDGQSRLLLYISNPDDQVQSSETYSWNFLGKTHSQIDSFDSVSFLVDQMVVGQYDWSIRKIDFYNLNDGHSRFVGMLTRNERFQLWIAQTRRHGHSIGWLPLGVSRHGNSVRNLPAPYDRYSPVTCLPLYDIETATTHNQPSRVLEFSIAHIHQQMRIELSRSGQVGIVHDHQTGSDVLIDVEQAEAIAHLWLDLNGSARRDFFVNDGQQLVRWATLDVQVNASHYQVDRHQVLIYDLPE